MAESMTRRRVRWRRLTTYVVIAYGGAWLFCLPLWLGQGLRTPHARAWIVAMMFTPALAGLVTVLVRPDGRRIVDVLGLRPAPFRRWWWTLLVGWLGPPLLVAVAVALAVLVGQFAIDWGTWSTFRATLPNVPLPMTLSTLLLISIASSVLANVWIAGALAAGEEIGWRGFLRDELSVLPRWALILATGLIWGLWHAPIILLGYNYPHLPPVVALGCMVVFTTLAAALLEWLRTVGTSIWPTALAHGALNTAGSLSLLLVPLSHQPSALTSGLLGWTGWLVMALTIGVLVLTGALRLRTRPCADLPVSSPRSGSVSARAGGADPSPDPGESAGRS